jgi:membrane-bound serine protease (ClpP class)
MSTLAVHQHHTFPTRFGKRNQSVYQLLGRLVGVTMILLGMLLGTATPAQAQTQDAVFVVPIHNEIDLGLAPFLARVLQQASDEQARAVILEINTPGGRLDAVLQMRDSILASPVRTIAFVNREAFSAGALVAIATDEIYMAPGSVIGAATPVDGAGTPGDEKVISAVRSTFRATAEVRERDPRVAEAMVDPEIAIDGVSARGELLTLTTSEAQQVGYADGVVTTRQELLAETGLGDATVIEAELMLAETVVRFLTNPLLASLLVSLGFLLVMADLFSGGFGAIGGIGLLLFGLFFWGHFLVGLAGWEGVALVVVGLALIALEVFVIPGFGIAGILGAAALLGGLFISLIGGDIVTRADLERASATVLGVLVFMALGTVMLLRFLPRAATFQSLILQSQVGVAGPAVQTNLPPRRWSWIEGERLEAHSATYTGNLAPNDVPSLKGMIGIARSDLRPGGIAEIGGERVDVVTRGDYIVAGEPIEVIADEGYRRVVRRITETTDDWN